MRTANNMKPEETIDFHLRSAWHRIARMYNNEAARHGGSMSMGYVLLNIDTKNGTPSTSLGPKMGMEARSLTRTLKTMEENKLICRVPDKNDKRMVRICLTEFGKEKRKLARKSVIRLNTVIQENLPKSKLNIFFEVVTKINDILDNKPIFNNKQTKNG